MNFGSQILALLKEHAVEQALGSIICPQADLQSAPLGFEQANSAEVLHNDLHFSMQSATGSSAGLFSGMIMTCGSSLGSTLVGILFIGICSGCAGAVSDSGTGPLVTTTSFGPASS